GIGFGKTQDHNVALLRHIGEFASRQLPILVGASRKRFLGALTGAPVDDRLPGSLAALVWCVLNGASMMRVHDVKASREAITVALAIGEVDKER
ncbi:MAG: dihydropteroate synthase, partial [Verrucomicrobia bacterium]|nr:dihydropteroate synthase [Verrucomicrobiota bacterium]